MSSTSCDIAIIGGGIVGLATALALERSKRYRIVVLEAEPRVAAHQTGHNSGVIHSGLYYRPGSLKARNCTGGREAMYAFCEAHGIPHERCGKVVVATEASQVGLLEELQRRGTANGLAGLRRLRAEEIRELEPHAAGVAGLLVPQTGIVNYRLVAEKMVELLGSAGCEVRLGTRVTGVRESASEVVLESSTGAVRCSRLINCGGLQCDRVARLCGLAPRLQIIPFRGEYYELVPGSRSLVKNLIYPVPDPNFPFLGVHFTRMVGGRVEAGPNAVLALKREGYRRSSISVRDVVQMAGYGGFWRMSFRHWRMGLSEQWRSMSKRAFVNALRRLVPEVSCADLVPAGAGVRAQAVDPDGALLDDFRIIRAGRMVHVLNAPSPAATASLNIGQEVASQIR
jgi:L-2-hydroxyglutarate oxidase